MFPVWCLCICCTQQRGCLFTEGVCNIFPQHHTHQAGIWAAGAVVFGCMFHTLELIWNLVSKEKDCWISRKRLSEKWEMPCVFLRAWITMWTASLTVWLFNLQQLLISLPSLCVLWLTFRKKPGNAWVMTGLFWQRVRTVTTWPGQLYPSKRWVKQQQGDSLTFRGSTGEGYWMKQIALG